MSGTSLALVRSAAALLILVAALEAGAADLPWRDARQVILVTSTNWDATAGVLVAFERDPAGWRRMHGPFSVALGRSGSAWGRGLHPQQRGPQKKEGDGRSPAGVFRIGAAFGYEASIASALAYRQSSASDYCIDVSGSPHYNRIVDANVVGQAAVARSTEPMRLDVHANGDVRYKLGFVIEHNVEGAPQGGSCIFAHLWRTSGEPTAGCTSMDEQALRALLAWLRPDYAPIFVLLPQGEYARRESSWRLPDL
jgi:L,D-peptidoglycan transpeptidase YkuD (ErfK/YbiS/YcfS/YnhG family)